MSALHQLPSHLSNSLMIWPENFQIGNAWIDDATGSKGLYDYFWTHALNSDQTHELIEKYCDFASENPSSSICINARRRALIEKGNIDFYNIYAPLCHDPSLKNGTTGSVSFPILHTWLLKFELLQNCFNCDNNFDPRCFQLEL